eukprot:m.27393 g.27393  ORF g.27393 m.27393 type:complete len:165 (-) comp4407_c0_seq2:108-602(-)
MPSNRPLLSRAERTYIEDGVAQNFRADGRQCVDMRDCVIERGVISNTNGSARVRVGGTDVLVGVKLEAAKPLTEYPNHGRIEFNVDCSAGASPAFVSRGGDSLSQELVSALRRLMDGGQGLDLEALCIIPGARVWLLHVDAVVLECAGGSVVDTCVSFLICSGY